MDSTYRIDCFYDGYADDIGKQFATRSDAEQYLRDEAIRSLNDPEAFIGDPAFDTCTEDDIADFMLDYEIVEVLDPHAVICLPA